MINEKIKGNFEQIKGKIKQQWGKLTDDEIESTKGDWNVLVGKLTERYGIGVEKAEDSVHEFLKTLNATLGTQFQSVHTLKENFNQTIENIKENVRDQFDRTTESVKQNVVSASEAIGAYVKSRPLASVATAFVAGAVVSVVVRLLRR